MANTQGIKLDDQTRQRLKALALKRDRSPHWLMKAAIEDYLDREEHYEREKAEDLQRWEQFELDGVSIDHTDVEPWLNQLADGKYTPWHQ